VSAADARRVVERAIAARVFPAAIVEVGSADRVLWNEAFGRLTFDDGAAAAAAETIFDLASLTKPLAATTVAMALVQEGALTLSAPIADYFDEWRGGDRETATVLDLLEHASGLPARLVDAPPPSRREFEHDICTIALEYAPRTQSIYSDLGFILLGFLLERVGGAPLDDLFDRIMVRLKADPTYENSTHPTDDESTHVTNEDATRATNEQSTPVSRGVRLQPDLLTFNISAEARHRTAPTDPMPQDPRRDRYFVLLSNRVCAGGTLDDMRTVRRAFHDALADV